MFGREGKLHKLISLLSRLPGVGEKTAQRYVLYLLISISLTIWVARTLHHNGRVFLVEAFHGNEPVANSSQLSLPSVTVPASARRATTVASNGLR